MDTGHAEIFKEYLNAGVYTYTLRTGVLEQGGYYPLKLLYEAEDDFGIQTDGFYGR